MTATLALALLVCGCDLEARRETAAEGHRRYAYERCTAAAALQNYAKQCEHIGGKLHVERRTYVCEDSDGNRNPQALGAGPYCTCREHDAEGRCVGEADCEAGADEQCKALLTAEFVPFLGKENER